VLGKFSRDHQWSRWLSLEDAVDVCEQMLRLVQAVSELPDRHFELHLRQPQARSVEGDDPGRLREALAGVPPERVDYFRYEASHPALPELSTSLRMDRLGELRMTLVVRGSNRTTVERIDAELRRAVRARLDAREIGVDTRTGAAYGRAHGPENG
jgi:hypothetical protein